MRRVVVTPDEKGRQIEAVAAAATEGDVVSLKRIEFGHWQLRLGTFVVAILGCKNSDVACRLVGAEFPDGKE